MLGSERKRRNLSTMLIPPVRTSTLWVSRTTLGPVGGRSCASRPLSCARRSSTSPAMKSTKLDSTASSAVKETALSTVASSFSALRPRSVAMLRISAAASLKTLDLRVSGRSSPEDPTGLAAPMLVPGAMTAKVAAAVMNVPAEAACAPRGDTNTTEGTSAFSKCWVILRVESRRPPGVSSLIMIRIASSSSARRTSRAMKRSVTELIMPLTSRTRTCRCWACATPTKPRATAPIRISVTSGRNTRSAARFGLASSAIVIAARLHTTATSQPTSYRLHEGSEIYQQVFLTTPWACATFVPIKHAESVYQKRLSSFYPDCQSRR